MEVIPRDVEREDSGMEGLADRERGERLVPDEERPAYTGEGDDGFGNYYFKE